MFDLPELPKKRKRIANEVVPDLEIDITQPEPLSRKSIRRVKKGKTEHAPELTTGANSTRVTSASQRDADLLELEIEHNRPARGEHGIWIGNLQFSVDAAALKTFLVEKGGIDEQQIVDMRLPVPKPGEARGGPAGPGPRVKQLNKGFGHVDFDGPETLAKALALTESLLLGRKVLIKHAKNFDGRPAQTSSDDFTHDGVGVIKSKRVFVGNLHYDTTKDDLETHFAQAGAVENVFVATFEDSGKCKGYAWVTFADAASAKSAVDGFVLKPADVNDEEMQDVDDAVGKDDAVDNDEMDMDTNNKLAKPATKTSKPRKWFINRLMGRQLRCEIAEDATVRYNKRYKSGRPLTAADASDQQEQKPRRPRGDKDERTEQRRQKHFDARNVKPGAALANAVRAPRASGAIVAGRGTKTRFA